MTVKRPQTRIASHSNDDITIRGFSLVNDLMGEVGMTDMLFLNVMDRLPSPAERRLADAVLVTLMEHGLTPSAIAARLVFGSSPENLQAGVAAGLLAVASRFVGTTENCAVLLEEILKADDQAAAAKRIAEGARAARQALPGFGHHLHKPDDPRTGKLFAIAEREGLAGRHVEAIRILGQAVDAAYGRHLTINATGAVAAVLGDMGVPPELMRGFAVVSRAAGLVGHIREEQEEPTMRFVWDLVEHEVPFVPTDRGSTA